MTNSWQLWRHVGSSVALLFAAGSISGALLPGEAVAQAYPSKVIRIIGQVASGSVGDVVARLVAPVLSSKLGKPVIIENRPGGGGTIGANEVARAAPDGHTLLFGGVNHIIVSKTLDYDPIKDFVPIATIATHHWVLVVAPTVSARSVKELIEHAKAKPGKLTWGFGQGSAPQMLGEMFKAAAGIELADIPYKSGTQAIPDMLGGRIDMNFGTVSNLLPLIREGKLRALAITSEARSAELSHVPTMAESGYPALTRGSWTGLWGPAGIPASIVSRLNSEVEASVTTPVVQTAMKKFDFEPKLLSSREFAAFILDEAAAWTPAAKAAGILSR